MATNYEISAEEEKAAMLAGKGNLDVDNEHGWTHFCSSGRYLLSVSAMVPQAFFEAGDYDESPKLKQFITDELNKTRARIQITLQRYEENHLREDAERSENEIGA